MGGWVNMALLIDLLNYKVNNMEHQHHNDNQQTGTVYTCHMHPEIVQYKPAQMQIRSMHQKMDLLLEEPINSLFDTQEKQFTLFKEINLKLDKDKRGNVRKM